MTDQNKFRSSYGLDAGGEQIVNVADASITDLNCAVNVATLIRENTVQEWKANRAYPLGFAVIHLNRLYVATKDISASATFNAIEWKSARTDEIWKLITSTYSINAGESIVVDSSTGAKELTLPLNPSVGDSVMIKEIGGLSGNIAISVVSSNYEITDYKQKRFYLSPLKTVNIIFINGAWHVNVINSDKRIKTATSGFNAQPNDVIKREFAGDQVIIDLPEFANDGDVIEIIGDRLNPSYSTVLNAPNGHFVGQSETTSKAYKSSGDVVLRYQATNKLWLYSTTTFNTTVKTVTTDATLEPWDSVYVTGAAGASNTIKLNLPTSVELGSTIKISLLGMRIDQTCQIIPSTGDTLITSKAFNQFPKRSEYPTFTTVSSLSISASEYVGVLELTYQETGSVKQWLVSKSDIKVERVDASSTATKARTGVIALATQEQANLDHENAPIADIAITPETLANRTATETRRGIARIATTAQVNLVSTATHADDLIITPKKLNERTSTETRRGLAELATQAETDSGVDDSTIVTPKKLNARTATETRTGIIELATRAEVVAGVDAIRAITPVNLKHIVQTEATWESTPTLRGFVRLSEGALTWVGDDVSGSTAELATYAKTGYAVSPYELNRVLVNYLPKRGKAVDSDKLDNLDSTQFIRRDVDQTVEGALTLTKPLAGTDVNLSGVITLKARGATASDVIYSKLSSPTLSKNWDVVLNDSTESTLKLKVGTATPFQITESGLATVPSLTVSTGVTNLKNTAVIGALNVTGGISTSGKLVLETAGAVTKVGIISDAMTLQVNNATANLKVQDSSGSYTVLNTKNAESIIDQNFVSNRGDTLTGRLSVKGAVDITISEAEALKTFTAKPVASNFGTWCSNITTLEIYSELPGYAVPVFDVDQDTGATLPAVARYDLIKGPGMLSQYGTDLNNTYQIWTPRPASGNQNVAQTFWIRNFSTATSTWGAWGRMFTSAMPPTASDIGAIAANGSVVESLTFNRWVAIGNLRILPDPTTKSVKFEWVE